MNVPAPGQTPEPTPLLTVEAIPGLFVDKAKRATRAASWCGNYWRPDVEETMRLWVADAPLFKLGTVGRLAFVPVEDHVGLLVVQFVEPSAAQG